MSERATIEVADAAELGAWLRAHHADSAAVWLVTGKRAAGERYLPYDAIVEQLLAWGWVDSKPGAVDELRSKRLIAPRKAGSAWSRANRERIAALEQAGRMQEAGREAVKRAREDGSWDRLKDAETGAAPPDLARALRDGGAAAGWDGLTLATRKRSLEWLLGAKTEPTRAKRVAAIVAAARDGRDPTLWKPKR